MFHFSLGAAAVATMMFIGVIDADAQGRTPVPLASLPGVTIQKVQLASTETQAIDVDVVSGCVSNVAMFQIVNVGEAWPRMGKLHIIRISNGNSKTLAKRSMRFAAG